MENLITQIAAGVTAAAITGFWVWAWKRPRRRKLGPTMDAADWPGFKKADETPKPSDGPPIVCSDVLAQNRARKARPTKPVDELMQPKERPWERFQ